MASRGIVYYSSGNLPLTVAEGVRAQLLKIGLPIVSCTLEPLDFGKNIVIEGQVGYGTMFRQILTALENSDADIVYHCEADNLMHPSHFDFIPPDKDKFYYDLNWWKVRKDGLAVHWDAAQVSGLCYYRELGVEFYKKRVATFDKENFDRKFEPTVDDLYETWFAKYPSIDIRHERNLTYNKWRLEHFRKKDTAVNFQSSTIDKIPGWDAKQISSIL